MKKKTISIVAVLAGAAVGAVSVMKFAETELKKERENLTHANQAAFKHLELFLMANQWIRAKQKGKNIADYLFQKGYHRIAVYGMSYVGDTLVEELKGSKIQVIYGIDRNADTLGTSLDVVTMEDKLEDVDAVIVTAITSYDDIKNELSKKAEFPVISLKDLLNEV